MTTINKYSTFFVQNAFGHGGQHLTPNVPQTLAEVAIQHPHYQIIRALGPNNETLDELVSQTPHDAGGHSELMKRSIAHADAYALSVPVLSGEHESVGAL